MMKLGGPSTLDLLNTGAHITLSNGGVLEGWPHGYAPGYVPGAVIRAGVMRDGFLDSPRFFPIDEWGLTMALRHIKRVRYESITERRDRHV